MVADKQHSRSIGPMVNLTRQPAEGRSRDGGLRFGEMERDCMISHGAARFTKERLYEVSDKYEVHVCKKCGLIASFNEQQHIHLCRTCGNTSDFSLVKIPYAYKLMMQELTTMNVSSRILTEKRLDSSRLTSGQIFCSTRALSSMNPFFWGNPGSIIGMVRDG